jgi:hypothetical protein
VRLRARKASTADLPKNSDAWLPRVLFQGLLVGLYILFDRKTNGCLWSFCVCRRHISPDPREMLRSYLVIMLYIYMVFPPWVSVLRTVRRQESSVQFVGIFVRLVIFRRTRFVAKAEAGDRTIDFGHTQQRWRTRKGEMRSEYWQQETLGRQER